MNRTAFENLSHMRNQYDNQARYKKGATVVLEALTVAFIFGIGFAALIAFS
jgi:hypothetical protein|tara:strand:- start:2437 stop:2589 length:153 start_codon:yes stop_codon:yes gene_type:complete